jgi:hypothetical protein
VICARLKAKLHHFMLRFPSSPLDSFRSLSARRKFTSDEDLRLRRLVEQYGRAGWEEVAKYMDDRTPRQCRDRYNNYLIDVVNGLPWTAEEDAIVLDRFRAIGPKWVDIAKCLVGRSANHVKGRWQRHLCRFAGQPFPEDRDGGLDPDEYATDEHGAVQLCPMLTIDWPRVFDQIEATLGCQGRPAQVV